MHARCATCVMCSTTHCFPNTPCIAVGENSISVSSPDAVKFPPFAFCHL